MTIAFIGLGSNLDNPVKQLDLALQALDNIPETRCIQSSAYYLSAPMVARVAEEKSTKVALGGSENQPDYVNAAAQIETSLQAPALLIQLQKIEDFQGRKRSVENRWGARTLDLDMLLFGDDIIRLPQLVVPHYGLESRAFVIFPLLEISSQSFRIPGSKTLGEIASTLNKDELQRIVRQ